MQRVNGTCARSEYARGYRGSVIETIPRTITQTRTVEYLSPLPSPQKGGGWVGRGGLEGNGRDLTAPRAGHLGETAGHGRAMAAVGADAVSRAPAHRQVDGVVGTFDEGPAVRARGDDLHGRAWDAARFVVDVECRGLVREARDFVPGAAAHAHVHVAHDPGPAEPLRHGSASPFVLRCPRAGTAPCEQVGDV